MGHWKIVAEEVERLRSNGRTPIIAFADSIFLDTLISECEGNLLILYSRWCKTGVPSLQGDDKMPENSIMFKTID